MKIITGYTGEKHITPADDAGLIRGILGSGDYVMPTGNQFKVTMQSNTEIKIADGDLVMQGRHARIDSGEELLIIENGTQGMMRNDLVVARYTKDVSTSVEAINLVVIKGTATSGTAADPTYNTGDIDNGETRDFPLYRVKLNGISIGAVEQLWQAPTFSVELKGLAETKLWTNPSPNSDFKTRTVELDLSEYDYVRVKVSGNPESANRRNFTCDVGEKMQITLISNAQTGSETRVLSRTVTVKNDGIAFGQGCSHATDTGGVTWDDQHVIPLEIYGVKGVNR